MKTRKQSQREAIKERARDALRDLYHNATPIYPRDVPDQYQDYFQAWFDDSATFEIEYLQDGGAYGDNYRKTLSADCNAGRYKSQAARNFYINRGMAKMYQERARCNFLDSREHQTNALWERISEYGKLYTYGRGGRTLAPCDLIRTGGGGSFSIREDYADEMNMESTMELIRIVESFNRAVSQWCKAVPEMWKEHFSELLEEKRRERRKDQAAEKRARKERKARAAAENLPAFIPPA